MLSGALDVRQSAAAGRSGGTAIDRTHATGMNCYFCGRAIEIRDRVGFRDECSACGRPAHICRNCGFYDPAYNNACRETMAERVIDKERANFCEYFTPAESRAMSGAKEAAMPATSPRAKLDELFKKK
jgi:hypothetical protein